MKQLLFVTGMFRSGTTLLSRILQAHGQMCCANDPLLPFFKELRNHVAATRSVELFQQNEPISDYYYDTEYLRLLDGLLDFDMNEPVGSLDLPALRQAIKDYCDGFATLIHPHMDLVDGATFRDLLQGAFAAVDKGYGGDDVVVTGMKNPWLDEFTPMLVRGFDNMKVVHVIRDPRAVCSSKLTREAKYPWLFMVRQWRKSGTLIHRHLAELGPERVHVVRYEDMVSQPETTGRALCDFLGVEFDPQMNNPEKFIDHDGTPWVANTSYSHKSTSITTRSLDKWREKLTADQIRFIETACGDVMNSFGYDPSEAALAPEAFMGLDLEMPKSDIAQWFHPFLGIYGPLPGNVSMEVTRRLLLETRAPLTEEQERFFFLLPGHGKTSN